MERMVTESQVSTIRQSLKRRIHLVERDLA